MSSDVPSSSSSLPFGLETIKPGAVRSMTSDKLASFSLGTTKKSAFQKHKEAMEAKRREQEEAAARELSQWEEQFQSVEEKPKAFVRGGVMGRPLTDQTPAHHGVGAGRGSIGGGQRRRPARAVDGATRRDHAAAAHD